MEKASVAERLLRCVMEPERASELVGDFLEARPDAGVVRFWTAMVRLVLRFSWRTLAGTIVSPVLGLILASKFFILVIVPDSLAFSHYMRGYCYGASILFWAAAMFALVRFGFRDVLTVVAFAASALWSTSFVLPWQHNPATFLGICWIDLFIFCMINVKRRRAFGIFCTTTLGAWVAAFLLYSVPRDLYGIFGKQEFLIAIFLIPVAENFATLYLHRKYVAPL